MQWKLKELQGRVQAKTGQTVTYEDIIAATGLAKGSITNIRTGRSKQVGVATLERLLAFFSERLGEPLTTSDLLEYRPATTRIARRGVTSIRPEFSIDEEEEENRD